MSDFEWLEKCLAKCIQTKSCVICSERACTYVCTCGAMICSVTCANVEKIGPTTMHKMMCKHNTNKSTKSTKSTKTSH